MFADLDELLGGLVPGDNVVWSYDQVDLVSRFEDAFLREGLDREEPCHYVTTSSAPTEIGGRFGPQVEVLDARPGRRFADLVRLEQTVLETARAAPGRFVLEGLDTFRAAPGCRTRARALHAHVPAAVRPRFDRVLESTHPISRYVVHRARAARYAVRDPARAREPARAQGGRTPGARRGPVGAGRSR